MPEETVWMQEERFWTGGAEVVSSDAVEGCLMVFGDPVGVLRGRGAICDSLAGAPRWSAVRMTDRVLSRPSADVIVIAYRARGERDGEPPYQALCSSTWMREAGRWKLALHQQTPVGGD